MRSPLQPAHCFKRKLVDKLYGVCICMSEDTELGDLFFNEKPVKALLRVDSSDEAYATQISREISCTYSHAVKMLNNFEEVGLVGRDDQGRKVVYHLTERGQEIVDKLRPLAKELHLDVQEKGGNSYLDSLNK